MNVKGLLLVDEEQDKIRIGTFELPDINPDQVLIRMRAAALNHRDQWCRQGMYPNLTYGVVLGSDGCGVVERTGSNVNPERIGERVLINPNINWGPNPEAQSLQYHILGMPTHGTLSEYLVVDEDRIHKVPEHLSDEEAAALPLGGLTAYRAAFTKGQVQSDMKVLVTGIGGGVAQFAFQFAKLKGAKVWVTSGNPTKLEKAMEMGATGGFDYKQEDWHKEAFAQTGGFDCIIDSAGGNNLNTYLKLIAMGGKIVHYGSTTGMPSKLDIFRLFWSQASIHGSTMGNDIEFGEMLEFVAQNKVVPVIDSVRPFNEVVSAFDTMKSGDQFGKLVISM